MQTIASICLKLSEIRTDLGTQSRALTCNDVVAEYAERMLQGDKFPPVDVFHDGVQYILADGFHRILAAERNEFKDFLVIVHKGTQKDALWFSLGANKNNGLRRTDGDKRSSVIKALKEFPNKSGNEVAIHIGVNQSTVSRIKSEVMHVHNLPEKVTGKDGKSYPASKPRKGTPPPLAVEEKPKSAGEQLVEAVGGEAAMNRILTLPPVSTNPANDIFVTDLKELSGKKFSCIYADPPWKYSNQSTRGSTDNHYETMTVDEIAALPIGELAEENCHLHLWTTNAFLFECPKIFAAWGFEFKSSFVWVKPQMGMGNYWRNSHEILLLGVKGSLTACDRGLMSWAEIKRGEHSTKPEEIRQMIEQLSPGPYLELFGRRYARGWTVFGNELLESQPQLAVGQ